MIDKTQDTFDVTFCYFVDVDYHHSQIIQQFQQSLYCNFLDKGKKDKRNIKN